MQPSLFTEYGGVCIRAGKRETNFCMMIRARQAHTQQAQSQGGRQKVGEGGIEGRRKGKGIAHLEDPLVLLRLPRPLALGEVRVEDVIPVEHAL